MAKQKPDIDAVKAELLKRRSRTPIAARDLLSTGSTLLNLAMSGKAQGGYFKGGYFHLVGDSNSGKSWLSMALLAEASIHPGFKDYALVHDNAENGTLMDIESFFGKALAGRLKPPGKRGPSRSLEQFFDHVDTLCKAGPCVYVLDSLDVLEPEKDQEAYREAKAQREKGKEAGGSYGTAKAKANSAGFRLVHNRATESGSVILAISQTRDNIGFGSQFNPKVFGGGNAPTFYAQAQLWSSVRQKLKKKVLGQDREVGTLCKVRVKKNRLNGRDRSVLLPIYHSLGIDDTGSMVDWLIEEGRWKEDKGKINTDGDWGVGPLGKEHLIQYLEGNDLVEELRRLTADVWQQIELASAVERKPRYT